MGWAVSVDPVSRTLSQNQRLFPLTLAVSCSLVWKHIRTMCLRLLLAGGSLALLLGMVACGQKGAATSVTSEGDNRVRLPARSDYTKFDPWLQKLLAKIDIVDDERKRFMRAYKAFEKDLVGVLRTEEPLFKLTFSRVHPTGSSFEGLRISSPNEFDMNAVLNLPLENKGDIQVREDEAAGHLTLTLLKSATDYFGETWFTNYIKQKGESFKINDIRNISRRRAGPAITFDVCTKAGEYLSVDFVPALSFQEDVLTKEMRKRGLKQLKELTNACKLPFFWDKKNNLLANMNESTCMNISKRLNIVSKSFEKSLTDDSEDPMIYFGTSKDGLKQRNTRNAAGGVCVI
ncbi:hypothetical protein FOCC_FOCC014690 [Frankliniella occidentalis]|nr:hypothetical protein FOCC_FOCC014690 [Frankliniella occidentalis]